LCLFRSKPTPRHVSEDERRFLRGSVPPWALLTESREIALAGEETDARVSAALAVAAHEFGSDLQTRANLILQARSLEGSASAAATANAFLGASQAYGSSMNSGEALETIAHVVEQAAGRAQDAQTQSKWLVASTTPCTPSIRPPTPYYLELRSLVPVRVSATASELDRQRATASGENRLSRSESDNSDASDTDEHDDEVPEPSSSPSLIRYQILQFPICSLAFSDLEDFLMWRGVISEMIPVLSPDHPVAQP